MKALVFGSAGYLGRRLVPQLRSAGFEVVGADIAPNPDLVDRVADIRFPEQTMATIHDLRPDVVIQLAYMLTSAAAVNLNIVGTNGIFEASSQMGVPRLVYASSAAVYGDQKERGAELLTEISAVRPRSLYGHMKLFNEVMAEQYNRRGKTRLIGIRISDLAGRGKRGFAPVDMVLEAASAKSSLTLPWSADHETSFVHVDDAAAVFVRLAAASAPRWPLYNTGGELLTMTDIAEIAREVAGVVVTCSSPGQDVVHVSRVSGDRYSQEFPGRRRTAGEWLALELAEQRSRTLSDRDGVGRRSKGSWQVKRYADE